MKRNDSDKSKRKTDTARRGRGTGAATPASRGGATAPFVNPSTRLSLGESYISLSSRPAANVSTAPIFYGSNPVGDALISTGIVDLAGASITSMVPLLPVGMAGLEVREALH